jgi:hypothetical protein
LDSSLDFGLRTRARARPGRFTFRSSIGP